MLSSKVLAKYCLCIINTTIVVLTTLRETRYDFIGNFQQAFTRHAEKHKARGLL